MTEFRLRQYSLIQSIIVAGNGTTPFGRDRWFQHPKVAGIGVPASRFQLCYWNRSSNLGSRSSIWEAEVLFGMTEFRLRQYWLSESNFSCRKRNYCQLPESELLPSVVTVGFGIPKLPESEFRHPVSIPVAGNVVPIWDDRTPIREAVGLFGMTEFRLRQYSSDLVNLNCRNWNYSLWS
ncbi:MAG: hypothetical protein WBI06_06225 [Paludibacter sp.]